MIFDLLNLVQLVIGCWRDRALFWHAALCEAGLQEANYALHCWSRRLML